MRQDERPEAAAGEVGMDKYGSDFGGIYIRVEEFTDAAGSVVASEEGFAEAPAAGSSENAGLVGWFGNEVGLVGNKLGIEAEGVAERAINLRGCVVVSLQAADGLLDEPMQRRDVGWAGEAEVERCGGVHGGFLSYSGRQCV